MGDSFDGRQARSICLSVVMVNSVVAVWTLTFNSVRKGNPRPRRRRWFASGHREAPSGARDQAGCVRANRQIQ